MLAIPFQVSDEEYSIYIGFDDEGLKRMRAYDPGEVILRDMGPQFTRLRLKDIIVGYYTAEDFATVQRLGAEGKGFDALKFLTRGFQFRADMGDHANGKPLSLIPDRKGKVH